MSGSRHDAYVVPRSLLLAPGWYKQKKKAKRAVREAGVVTALATDMATAASYL
jgi:hypothetical protein